MIDDVDNGVSKDVAVVCNRRVKILQNTAGGLDGYSWPLYTEPLVARNAN